MPPPVRRGSWVRSGVEFETRRYTSPGWLRYLHFITRSCYRRRPLLNLKRRRDLFLKMLDQVRRRYQFLLVGFVVMPEHIHLLISEPKIGTPSAAMQVLKQRVSRGLRRRRRKGPNQPNLWTVNVWSQKKKIEKLHYMHTNPVKRGLVTDPKLWPWSSYRFYQFREVGLCSPDLEVM